MSERPPLLGSLARLAAAYSGQYRNSLPRRVQTTFQGHKNFVDRLIAVRRHYVGLRGGFKAANHRRYPRTTNADVLQLATLWSRELGRVSPENGEDRAAHARWKGCVDAVARIADTKAPEVTYPQNMAFWMCSLHLAIYLESRRGRPSKWTLFREALSESIIELPSTVAGAADRAASGVTSTANAVAGALSTPAKVAIVAVIGIAAAPPVIRALRD